MRDQDNIEKRQEKGKLLEMSDQKIVIREVAIIYYLSRYGKLDHPHCIKVHLPSPGGLYLKDFTNALIKMRGQGMTSMYSWSSKRSYRTGYVWQDLSGDDFIHPCHDNDYVLKGSLVTEGSLSCRRLDMKTSMEVRDSAQGSSSSVARRRTNSWSTIDNLEEPSSAFYKEQIGEHFKVTRADSSTQTCCQKSGDCSNGRLKISAILMDLMGCGFKFLEKKKKGHSLHKVAAKEVSIVGDV